MTLDLGVTDSLHLYLSNYYMSGTEEIVMNKTLILLLRSFHSGEKHLLSLYCVHCSNHLTSISTLLIPHNYRGCRYHNHPHFTSKNSEQHGGVQQGAGARRWQKRDLNRAGLAPENTSLTSKSYCLQVAAGELSKSGFRSMVGTIPNCSKLNIEWELVS